MASLSRLDRCVPTGFGAYVRSGVHKLVAAVAASALLIGVAPAVVAQTEDAAPSTESAPAVVVPAEDDDSTIEPTPAAAAQDDDTARVEAGVSTYTDGQVDGVYEYLSGVGISPEAWVSVSGANVNYQDVTFTLTIPKNDPYVKSVVIAESGVADSCARNDTTDAYVMVCKKVSLTGGTLVSLPFAFKFENVITPNGTEQAVNWIVKSADGTLDKNVNVVYRALASTKYQTHITGYTRDYYNAPAGGFSSVRHYSVNYREGDPEPTHTPSTGRATDHAVFHSFVPDAGATDAGEYPADWITSTVKLPQEAEFNGTSATDPTEGWVYNPETHSVTTTVHRNNTCNLDHTNRTYCRILPLLFKNAPFKDASGQTIAYKLLADSVVGQGDKYEHQTETVVDRVAFVGKKVPVFRKEGEIKLSKYHIASTQYDPALYSKKSDAILAPMSFSGWWVKLDNFDVNWQIEIRSYNNGSAENQNPYVDGQVQYLHETTDQDLDEALYFKNVTIEEDFFRHSNAAFSKDKIKKLINNSSITLYGVKADGTEIKIAENMRVGRTVVINDVNRQYVKLLIRYGTPLRLDNFGIRYAIKTGFTESGKEGLRKATDSSVRYNNSASSRYSDDEKGAQKTISSSSSYRIEVNSAELRLSSGDAVSIVYTGCNPQNGEQINTDTCPERVKKFNFKLEPRDLSRWVDVSIVKNLRNIVLLPPGVEYVRTTKTLVNGVDLQNIVEPMVVTNFNNTGKTALIYNYGDVDKKDKKYDFIYSEYELDTTLYAKKGDNIVETYAIWDNNDEIFPYITYSDVLDLDGDGDVKEHVAKSSYTIKFTPPSELVSKTYVSTDGIYWAFNAPAVDLGDTVYYKLIAANSGRLNIGGNNDHTLSLISVLPDRGRDHKTVANAEGVYLPRTWQMVNDDGTTEIKTYSGFDTPLTKALEDVDANKSHLERFEFFYSTTEQGADLASVRDAQWLTKDKITDWSLVKAVKINLRAGAILRAGEELGFVTENRVAFNDDNRTLASGTRAVTSVAASLDAKGYLEANEVTAEIAKYSVSGVVFNDADKDGSRQVCDAADTDCVAEAGVRGYEVALFNADANPTKEEPENGRAVNPDGVQIPAVTTNSEGAYKFDVYKRGAYKVGFRLKDSNQPFTIQPESPQGELLDSHVVNRDVANQDAENYGLTAAVALNPLHRHAVLNAGVEVLQTDIPLLKRDQFQKAQQGVEFTLAWSKALDGDSVADGEQPAAKTLTTGSDGKLTFEGVRYGVYTLTERPRAGYVPAGPWTLTVKADGISVEGENTATIAIESAGINSLTVTNTRIQGSVSLVKVDSQNPDIKLADAIFQLLDADGTVKYTLPATDSNGYTRLDGIDFGKYVLKESVAPTNYVASDKTWDVDIDEHEKVIEIGQIPNTINKRDVIQAEPKAYDPRNCTDTPWFVIPETEGAKFTVKIDGVTIDTWLYDDRNYYAYGKELEITAWTETGYEFAGGAETRWVFEAFNRPASCDTPVDPVDPAKPIIPIPIPIPVNPTNPANPATPVNPTSPATTVKPGESHTPSADAKNSTGSKALAVTGTSGAVIILAIAGLSIAVLGALVLFLRRTKRPKE